MLKTAILFFTSLLSAALTQSAQAETIASSAAKKPLTARFFINSDGKITRFEWTKPELVSASLNAFLTPQIQAVRFEPAKLKGQSVNSELLMRVNVRENEEIGNQSSVGLVDLARLPTTFIKRGFQKYPAKMMRAGVNAFVILRMEFGLDGYPIEESIAIAGKPSEIKDAHIELFYEEAKRASMDTQFALTEKVANQFVGGNVYLPFVFCMDKCDSVNAEMTIQRKALVASLKLESGISLAQVKSSFSVTQ